MNCLFVLGYEVYVDENKDTQNINIGKCYLSLFCLQHRFEHEVWLEWPVSEPVVVRGCSRLVIRVSNDESMWSAHGWNRYWGG